MGYRIFADAMEYGSLDVWPSWVEDHSSHDTFKTHGDVTALVLGGEVKRLDVYHIKVNVESLREVLDELST